MEGFSGSAFLALFSILSAFTAAQITPVVSSSIVVIPQPGNSTTSVPLAPSTTTGGSQPASSTAIPATCIQVRSPADPPGADISATLASASAVANACGGDQQKTGTVGLLSIVYSQMDAMFLNISHNSRLQAPIEVGPTFCPNHFQSIIDQCITNGNFWGGWIGVDAANYSITDSIYPANGLNAPAPPGSSGGASSASTTTGVPRSGSTTTGVTPPATTTPKIPPPATTATDVSSLMSTTTGTPPVASTPAGAPPPGSTTTGVPSAATTTTGAPPPESTTSGDVAPISKPPVFNPPGSDPPVSNPPSSTDSVPLRSGATIVIATINSQVVSETFSPTTDPQFSSLSTTLSTFSTNSLGSTISYKIGPGGVEWQPLTPSTGTNYPDILLQPLLPPNPNGPPSGSLAPSTTTGQTSNTAAPGQTTTGPASATTPPTTDAVHTTGPLTTISSYDTAILSISTIDGITANTHISTSDGSHHGGIYPVLFGCWFCGGAGFVLWGMTGPGIYPPPPVPPVTPWPNIEIGNDGNPTPDPSSKPSGSASQPSNSQPTTAPSTASATTTAASTTATDTSTGTGISTATASASASNVPCKRDLFIRERSVWHPRLGKRKEQEIAGTDPMKSALSNLGSPDALDSATGLITNRIGDKGGLDANGKLIDLGTANTFVSGLVGKLEIPQGESLTIGGTKFTGTMPWTIRWDYDDTKLTHVNAKFGKSGEATFAYTFSTGNNADPPTKNTYADGYMRQAVRSLTQKCRLDIDASHKASMPVFLHGTTKEEATQTVIDAWKRIMEGPCPFNSDPLNPNSDPNDNNGS